MQDDNIPTWEMPPGSNPEKDVSETDLERAEAFENAMSDAPPFAGENTDIAPIENSGDESEFDEGMNDAAKLLSYINNAPLGDESLDAVADAVIEIDGSSNDPVGEMKKKLGFADKSESDTTARQDKLETSEFATNENASGAIDYKERTSVNARAAFGSALSDFKEWVSEVRGSDPKYAWARQKAMDAGVGVFDYLQKYTGAKGLADVFQILSTHEDEVEEISEAEKQADENAEDNVEAKSA